MLIDLIARYSVSVFSKRAEPVEIANNFNSSPYDKILEWPNSKAFADDKFNLTKNMKYALCMAENIEGKGKNAGYQHFLLLPQCFQNTSVSGSLKVGIVW